MAERRLGLYSEQFVPDLHEEMGRTVRAAGARVEGWFYCPHHPRAVTDALRAEWGAVLSYSDPYVPTLAEAGIELESVPVNKALVHGLDCALITTNHECFDYEAIVRQAPLVVDTRNALKGMSGAHIFRL